MRNWVVALKQTSLAVLILLLVVAANVRPQGLTSGLQVGEFTPAFEPTHVAGPDQGTNTCPVCKYGLLPACQVWINNDDPQNVIAIMQALDQAVASSPQHRLHAFVIAISPTGADLSKLATEAGVKHVGIAFVKGGNAADLYHINTSVKNTVMGYSHLKVAVNLVNFKADAAGVAQLQKALLGLQ